MPGHSGRKGCNAAAVGEQLRCHRTLRWAADLVTGWKDDRTRDEGRDFRDERGRQPLSSSDQRSREYLVRSAAGLASVAVDPTSLAPRPRTQGPRLTIIEFPLGTQVRVATQRRLLLTVPQGTLVNAGPAQVDYPRAAATGAEGSLGDGASQSCSPSAKNPSPDAARTVNFRRCGGVSAASVLQARASAAMSPCSA